MNRTVLIVEDEADLAATFARLLARRHLTVLTVGTCEAALDAVTAARRPALAIVDRRLPDGDGLDVLRAARAVGMPVIVTSGHDWRTTRRLALEGGAVAFLGKPFSSRDLLDLVDKLLHAPPPGSGDGVRRPGTG